LSLRASAPPVVTLVQPADGSIFYLGEPISFQAEATDPDGRVVSVTFYVYEDTELGTATEFPFRWEGVLAFGPQYYPVRARATDDAGLVSFSDEVWFLLRERPGVPPVNDAFANRIPMAGASADWTGSVLHATFENGEPEFHRNHSVWWSWVAPSNGVYTVVVSGLDFSPYIAAYDGSDLEALSLVAFGELSGQESRMRIEAVAGVDYAIAVGTYWDTADSVALSLRPGGAPEVVVTHPSSGVRVVVDVPVLLSADVTDPDGNLDHVEFLLDEQSVASFSGPPYETLVVFPDAQVNHAFRVRAVDATGLRVTSDPVYIFSDDPPPANDDFANRIHLTGGLVRVEPSCPAVDFVHRV
jgi:hypothetical protein